VPGIRGWATLDRMASELPDRWYALAELQHGLLSRRQALSLGADWNAIRARLRSSRWQQVYRGVYATFTGELGREASMWAALLRAGPEAILSHDSAAEMDGLKDRANGAIHIMVNESRKVPRTPGIVIHRSQRIWAAVHPSRIPPRTRVEETALDLAERAKTLDDAFSWLARACGGQLTTADRLRLTMDSRKKMRWRMDLAVALADIGDGVHSLLEYRYVRYVERAHGLPSAKRQAPVTIGGRRAYLDNLYQRYGVGTELDGSAAHPIAERWRDIHRDNAAAEAGIEILRYNGADVTGRPCQVAGQVAAVLRRHGWQPTLRRCGPHCTLSIP
jgi:predicted transcriptional regulator of viral defense system/very-short-patch-repair endonuclease